MKRNAAGDLIDSRGRRVPDAALNPRAAARERARRAGARAAERGELAHRPTPGRKRSRWWQANRIARYIARRMGVAMEPEAGAWEARDDDAYGGGHVASYGTDDYELAGEVEVIPRSLPKPAARVDSFVAKVTVRLASWIVDTEEEPGDSYRDRPPDGERWRTLLPFTVLSEQAIALAALLGMHEVALAYFRGEERVHTLEVAVHVRRRRTRRGRKRKR